MRLALLTALVTLLLVGSSIERALTEAAAVRPLPPIKRSKLCDSPKDKAMALVPGATFEMGTAPSEITRLQQAYRINRADVFSAEAPRHTVTIDSFYIDKYEVTNEQFKRFIDKNSAWRKEMIPNSYHNGSYLKGWDKDMYPPGKANYPATYVSWYAAVAFCQCAGKRLPTEAEWEYAARGGLSGKEFPWGDEPATKARANFGESGMGEPVQVGSYPANGYGLYDMAGNVWEYMADEWGPYPPSPQINPVGGGSLYLDSRFYSVKTRRVIRGGSWGGAAINLRVTYRDSHPPEGAGNHVGFRCAKSAPKKKTS